MRAHDELVGQALAALACEVELVVLAQASMARVVQQLPAEEQGKFLSSPRLAMERVRTVLAGQQAEVAQAVL